MITDPWNALGFGQLLGSATTALFYPLMLKYFQSPTKAIIYTGLIALAMWLVLYIVGVFL